MYANYISNVYQGIKSTRAIKKQPSNMPFWGFFFRIGILNGIGEYNGDIAITANVTHLGLNSIVFEKTYTT